MNGKRAKEIKINVLTAMYGTDLFAAAKKQVYKDIQFRKVYRAAKRNYTRHSFSKTVQE